MKSLSSLTVSDLNAVLKSMGEKSFRAKQIRKAILNGVICIEDITSLSKSLRQKLSINYSLLSLKTVNKLVSQKDGTVKYLNKTDDNEYIETVCMIYKHGSTVCVSTQAGCRMGCAFCASAITGLSRNLKYYEMLDQVLRHVPAPQRRGNGLPGGALPVT